MIEENMNISIQRDQTWSFVQKKRKDKNLVIGQKEKQRLANQKQYNKTNEIKIKTY